ncbi:MAG: metallophosphoesterase [Oceanidesulfovibrio sp.]
MGSHEEHIFIGVGDIHENVDTLMRIPELKNAYGVIVSGDLTNGGGPAQALRVLEAVRAANPNVFAQLGNMDKPEVNNMLEEEGVNIHLQARPLVREQDAPEGMRPGIIGVGMSGFTPFGTPSEVSDTQLGEWLDEAYAMAGSFDPLLVVVHNPPHDTKTDVAGGGHVGSKAVRKFLERTKPAVCLTGHIHESMAVDIVGETKVINPGALGGGGYALIRVSERGLDAELKRV